MIRVVIDRQLACPKVFCDHCGEVIEGQGNYEWKVGEAGLPETGEVFHTHKQCCRAFEEAHGGRSRWYCDRLGRLPMRLLVNLEVTS